MRPTDAEIAKWMDYHMALIIRHTIHHPDVEKSLFHQRYYRQLNDEQQRRLAAQPVGGRA